MYDIHLFGAVCLLISQVHDSPNVSAKFKSFLYNSPWPQKKKKITMLIVIMVFLFLNKTTNLNYQLTLSLIKFISLTYP